MSVVVADAIKHSEGKDALILGKFSVFLFVEDKLVYVGDAGTGK